MRDLRHQQARAADDLADWVINLEVRNKRPKTQYEYVRVIACLLRRHPQKRMCEFTAADVEYELAAKPPRSRAQVRAIYAGWFRWGLMKDRIETNPMMKVDRVQAQPDRPRDIYTDAERGQLEALPLPDGPLWALLFGTGLRKGEARRLRRGNIDLERARLMVINGKGGKDRMVGIPGSVVPALADLDLFEQLLPEEHLWYRANRPAGHPLRRRDPIGDSTFDRWYDRCILQADVRHLNAHQTRHTYGYWLRNQGQLTLQERALLMGHEDIRMTQRYDRISIDDLAEKMAAL